jgi:hypothetical protein
MQHEKRTHDHRMPRSGISPKADIRCFEGHGQDGLVDDQQVSDRSASFLMFDALVVLVLATTPASWLTTLPARPSHRVPFVVLFRTCGSGKPNP